MKTLILSLMLLVALAAARPAAADCICNHMPCPCAAVDGPICRMTPRICPILIDPVQLIKPPTA